MYALLNCSSTLQSNWYEHDDFVHTYVVSVAVGWFIWDVIECAQHTEWGPLFLVHGIVALGIFSSCMVSSALCSLHLRHTQHLRAETLPAAHSRHSAHVRGVHPHHAPAQGVAYAGLR